MGNIVEHQLSFPTFASEIESFCNIYTMVQKLGSVRFFFFLGGGGEKLKKLILLLNSKVNSKDIYNVMKVIWTFYSSEKKKNVFNNNNDF